MTYVGRPVDCELSGVDAHMQLDAKEVKLLRIALEQSPSSHLGGSERCALSEQQPRARADAPI